MSHNVTVNVCKQGLYKTAESMPENAYGMTTTGAVFLVRTLEGEISHPTRADKKLTIVLYLAGGWDFAEDVKNPTVIPPNSEITISVGK